MSFFYETETTLKLYRQNTVDTTCHDKMIMNSNKYLKLLFDESE